MQQFFRNKMNNQWQINTENDSHNAP